MTRRPTASSCIRHELKAGMTTVVTRSSRDFVGTVFEAGQHRGVIVDYHNCTLRARVRGSPRASALRVLRGTSRLALLGITASSRASSA